MKTFPFSTAVAAATIAFALSVPVHADEAPLLTIILKPSRIDPVAGTGTVDVKMKIDDVSVAAAADLLAHQPGGPRMTQPIGITDMTFHDAAGAVPLKRTVEQGWEIWRADRAVRGDVTLSYTTLIDNSAGGILSSIPYIDGPGVSGIGSMLLALPLLEGNYRLAVRWDLSDMPDGAEGITTYGDGDFTLAAGEISRLDDMFLMAGTIKSAPKNGAGGFKAVWTGNPQFDIGSAMEWAGKLYRFNSAFFADPVEPRYRVFLRENPYNPSNGTATIQAFAMGYGKGTTAEKMKTILGHEMTHTWTANDLGKWYTEGNAVYYQARSSWNAGLVSIENYLTDINLTAARYYSSDVIHAPDADVLPNFWEDLRYNVLSYDRGAMYFAVLNGEIHHASGGRRSVDDLVRVMVAMQRDEGKEPTEADWVTLLRNELGEPGVELHRAMLSGEKVMIPRSDAFGPCFRRVKAKVRRYDLGFGGVPLKRHKVVADLRANSEAAKAGLRNGDEIEYVDSTEGTMRHPDMPLHMKVTRNGKTFETSYLPRGDLVDAYQWELILGEALCTPPHPAP